VGAGTSADPARRDPTFQGRTYDAGLGLYDYRNRSFDPATGRFLQRDPVLDGGNLYNPYAGMGNNPVGNVDPMGTWLYSKTKPGVAGNGLTKGDQ
jgi:RHS repeat-associated protein